MAIYKWVREFIEKYSFIKSSELKNGNVYFYYEKDNKIKFKRLPFRADKNQVIKMIESIKKDINYEEEKVLRDYRVKKDIAEDEKKEKNMIFGFSE